MARFEQLKEYQSAADYYRKYLDISPKAKDREQVEITISTMIRLAQDGDTEARKVRTSFDQKGVGECSTRQGLSACGSMFECVP